MEARARAQLALDLDGPAVFPHNAIRHRKPQPGALFGAFRSEEWVVYTFQVLWRDALPIVTYIDAREPVRVPGPDCQPSTVFHGVAGVQEQVQEDLLQLTGITLHGR